MKIKANNIECIAKLSEDIGIQNLQDLELFIKREKVEDDEQLIAKLVWYKIEVFGLHINI